MSHPRKRRPVCRQASITEKLPAAGSITMSLRWSRRQAGPPGAQPACHERTRPPRGIFPLQTSDLLCTVPIHPLDPFQGLLQDNQVLGLPTRAAAHAHALLVPCQQADRFRQRAFRPRRDAREQVELVKPEAQMAGRLHLNWVCRPGRVGARLQWSVPDSACGTAPMDALMP